MNSNNNKPVKDCFECRMIGTFGFLGISIYLFYNGLKYSKLQNKLFINMCGTGK